MSVDLESLHRVLRHPIRRKIVLTLLEKKGVAYTDLMGLLEVENTGKLNYHLKILGDLIEKNENGKYRLTEKGYLASQLLLRFPEKKIDHMPLRGGDAVLIGFVGFLLAVANPGFWGFSLYLIGLLGIGIIAFLGLVYALIVPAGVMWLLTVRRTNSHDPYDLFKPPLVAFALIMLLLIIMRFLNLSVTIYVPDPEYPGHGYGMFQPVLPSFLTVGFLLFIGVTICETIYKVLQKRKLR